MAPKAAAVSIDTVEEQLKTIIHHLYSLMVQAHDYQRDSTPRAMTESITHLTTSIVNLSRTSPAVNISVPPELIQYVESGRNPDVYSREFVELAQRMNQQLKGKSAAFGFFRDALAREIMESLPELKEQVVGILSRTGASVANGQVNGVAGKS